MTLHDVQHASILLVHFRVKSLRVFPVDESPNSAQTEHVCSHVVGFCEDGS